MGFEHAEPEPVVIEEAPDTEPIADAAVEIARIEANKEVTIAKIEHRAIDEDLTAQLAALAAENEALRAQLAPPEPEGGEVAVVVAQAEAEAEPPAEEPPPVVEQGETAPEEKPSKRRSAWWG